MSKADDGCHQAHGKARGGTNLCALSGAARIWELAATLHIDQVLRKVTAFWPRPEFIARGGRLDTLEERREGFGQMQDELFEHCAKTLV